MKKIRITVLIIAILLITAQNITMFKIPSLLELELGTAFWISFGFCNLAFLVTTLILWFGLSERKDATIHAAALLGVSYTYLIEEIALANAFTYIPHAKVITTLLLQLASFLIYGATILMVLLGIFWKEKNNKLVSNKVNFIYSLELELSKAENNANNFEVKKAIGALKEKVHYSDPMSNEKAGAEEAQLVLLVPQVSEKCNSTEEVMSLIKEIEDVLKIRNEICLRTK